jgi:hypothetical protein
MSNKVYITLLESAASRTYLLLKRVKDVRSLGSYITRYKISVSSKMCVDILNIEEESKIGVKVNIIGSNDRPHAFMWQINVGHDERKSRKSPVAEVKKICQEIYEIKLNEQG